MIVELMAYTTAVSLLVGLGALAVERAVALGGWPRRWLWAAAVAFSIVGPAGFVLSTHSRAFTPVSAPGSRGIRQQRRDAFVPLIVMAAQPRQLRGVSDIRIPMGLETSAEWMWLGSSLSLVGLYVLGAVRLRALKRRWSPEVIGPYRVFVADDVGPAVVGLFRPAIVLPRWLLGEPAAIRDTALTHESEHIAARDPGLMLAALLLLAVAPWNVSLWWQLRRLRLAIEIDCDRRVLDAGMDGRHYTNTLLRVNQRVSSRLIGSMAIAGRVSQIERRVRAMIAEPPRYVRLWMATWIAVAIPVVVAAAELSPPALALDAPPSHRLEVVIADFDANAAATSATIAHRPGALVTDVVRGGPADLAGVLRGDVILQYGDTPISGAKDLMTAVAHTRPGAQHVPLVIIRDSGELHLVVEFPAASQVPQPRSGQRIEDASDWDALRDANLAVQDPTVEEELIQMSGLNEMQNMLQLVSEQPPPPHNTAVLSFAQIQAGAEPNVRRLKDIIAQYGWPTISVVGVRGAHAAAYIALGATNPDFQRTALELMAPLVPRGEVPTADYASLYDQVHTPQRYGTAIRCENGEFKPSKPIEDPGQLAQRRAALGLPDMPRFCVTSGSQKTR